jgi:NAD(P)-dependent dehydrogenase (short-subunit alcohol dehydrogenase family)
VSGSGRSPAGHSCKHQIRRSASWGFPPRHRRACNDPLLAYGQSKTAAILFAVGATARWAEDGITANALNPGAIATNLQRHVGGKLLTPPERQKTPEQGAATSVLLATSDALLQQA